MKLDGKAISSEILQELIERVKELKKKKIIPTMAIILMGDNEASKIYVRQKGLKAEEIGAKVKVFPTSRETTHEELTKLIKKLDKDPKIHGIIIQRPAGPNVDIDSLTELISGIKEVDGFGKHSKYPVPVAEAAFLLIKKAYKESKQTEKFTKWIHDKKIAVIGKGETAGKPIIDLLKKHKLKPQIIDSKTPNKEKVLKEADIIITAVGKTILSTKQFRKGVILIGVGLYTDENGKLRGDYNNSDVENVASFYSPTPGGVGPVNVACLMENLVKAAENSIK